MKGFFKPVNITALGLLVLYGLAVYFSVEDYEQEVMRVVVLAAGLLIPHLVLTTFKVRPQISNLLISLVILLLLADQGGPLLMILALGLVTAIIKTVVRLHHQPIFNPAAAGLLAMSFLGLTTTWWGVSFSPRLPFYGMSVTMLVIVPLGLWIVYKYKKWPTLVMTTLVFSAGYFLLRGTVPLRALFEGTFAFFLFFMATEPKTTPLLDWQEWIYGGLLGGLLVALPLLGVSNSYLVALLTLNLLFTGYKWGQLKMAG